MQRAVSSSPANYRKNPQLTNRFVPIQVAPNSKVEYYSSDSDSQHLQRTSSTSSCSTASTNSANYRILPVRYSSVDRVLPQPATVTASEHGINVRIRFDRPRHHHHHHHHEHRREHTEEYEHYRTKQSEQYNSCPILNTDHFLNSHRRSNINCIETRSIVRGYSSDQINKNTHSTTLIIRQQPVPPPPSPIAHTQIKHIPLDIHSMFKPIMTRVIQKNEE
jgi:hypothetical protein